jgi:hypothetical protein
VQADLEYPALCEHLQHILPARISDHPLRRRYEAGVRKRLGL